MKKIISIFLVFISIFSLIPCNAVSAVTVLPNTETGPVPPKSVYFSQEEVERYFQYPSGTNIYYFYDEVVPVDNAIKNAFVEMNLNDKDYFHKLLTIYQWVGTNIHYGVPHTNKYSELYEGLVLHNGNCSTSAMVFHMFCIKAGIDKNNIGFVTGINGFGAHAVNLVKFEELWYSVDTSDNAATSALPFMEALSNLGMTDLDFSVPKDFSKNKLAKYSLPFKDYQSNSKPISTEDFNFSMRQICGTKKVSLSWNMPQYIKCVQVFEYHDESFLTVGKYVNFDTGKPYCTNLSSILPFFNRNDNITTLEFDISEDTEFRIVGYGEYYQIYKSPILTGYVNAVINETHTFGAETTKAATCTENGYRKRVCSKCAYEDKVVYKALGHKLDTLVDSRAATCTKSGYKTYRCSVCHNEVKQTVKALGHKYDKGKITKQPTFKAAGIKTYTCSKCHGTKTESVAKLKSPALNKLSAGKKNFKATWKKINNIGGYQLQYSTYKSFKKSKKTITVKGNSTTAKTVKKLKANKRYYVRIRGYKTINGKRVYSAWSKSKSIKTKG